MPAIVLMLAALLSTSVQADSATGLVGDYYRGDGRGMNVSLSIKTDGTYFIALDGCLGRYAQAEGVTRVADHILILEAASPPAPGDELMLPSRLLIVRWDDRLYLVPESDGPLFAAYVTRGWEPRSDAHGWFLLRELDWQKPTGGVPELPAEWRTWLLRTRVEARVSRVLARHRAEINAGSKRGVQPGLLLNLVSRKYGPSDVRVLAVRGDVSIIENDYGDPPMEIGRRVTSRPQ